MANATNTLIVKVVVDDKTLSTMLEKDRRAVERLGQQAERSGKSLGALNGRTSGASQAARGALSPFGNGGALLFGSSAFVGAAAAATAIKVTASAASDLNEQITKSQQIFGDSSQAIIEWSKATGSALGTSREQALEAAGVFGNLFSSIHLGSAQSAEVSKRLVQLAADLASFNNASPEDTFVALRAGLVGEAEPLRRYGVLLSEARVAQVALAQTGKETAKQLTAQDKTLARISIIFQDTAKAQGDFARTSGGLANQQRILSAEIKNLEADVGTALLPVIKQTVSQLADATRGVQELFDGLRALGRVKIPPIRIPIVKDIVGDKGTTAGKLASKLVFTLGDFIDISESTVQNLIDDFKDETDKAAPKVIQGSAVVMSDFLDNVLISATKQVSPSVSFGDLLSNVLGANLKVGAEKLITDIPNLLQEKLLDVQIKSPDNHQALTAVLEQQRNSLTKALDNPDLKSKQRIDLKQKLKGVLGAIDSENDAIKRGVQDAADARQKTIDDAKNKADEAKQKLSDKFAAIITGLQLGVDKAGLTKGLNDDLARLKDVQKGLLKQVKAGVDVSAAQSQLVQVTGQIADKQQEIKQKALDAEQARQFRTIGLSATGDQITPGIDNLKKQLSQLTTRLGPDITPKIKSQLAGISKALNDPIHKATITTRKSIKDLFDTIRQTFDKESKGPLTKTTSLNANKILDGLGLGRDVEKQLRARLSNFNSAGVGLAGMQAPTGSFRTPAGGAAGGDVVVNITTTLDGQVVAQNTTRHQQQTRRRNPRQKRGPNRNI